MNEATVTEPVDGPGWQRLAELRWAEGERGEAREAAAQAVKLMPRDVGPQLRLAQFDLAMGKPALAAEGFLATLTLDSGLVHAWAGLAEALWAQDQHEAAIAAARKAAAAAPQDWAPAQRLGQFLTATGADPVEIEAVFRAAVTAGAKDGHARLGVAEALWRQGKTDEAIEEAKAAAGWSPENVAAQHRLGEFLLLTGKDRAGAEAAFRAALAVGPAYLAGSMGLIEALLAQKKFEAAVDAYAEARTIWPSDPYVPARYGQLLAAAGGDTRRAEGAFREALAIDPHYGAALVGMVDLFRKVAPGQAVEAAREAAEAAPDDVWVVARLGETLIEAEDYVAAEAAFRRVLEIKPDFSYALLFLSESLRLQKRIKDAIAMFRQAERANPDPQHLALQRFHLFGYMD